MLIVDTDALVSNTICVAFPSMFDSTVISSMNLRERTACNVSYVVYHIFMCQTIDGFGFTFCDFIYIGVSTAYAKLLLNKTIRVVTFHVESSTPIRLVTFNHELPQTGVWILVFLV